MTDRENTPPQTNAPLLTCQCENSKTDPCIVCGKGKTLVTAEWMQKMAGREGDHDATTGTPSPQTKNPVMAPADYQEKLSDFLDALDEWGCEDNAERAVQIIEFQRTGYDLDAYLVEHPDRPKSEVN